MEEYIKKLRQEAKDLLEDTLVSLNEEIRNEIMAKKLNKIAKDLEKIIKMDH